MRTHADNHQMQEVSVSLCRGKHRIVAAYASAQTRVTGCALIPRLPVPKSDITACNAHLTCLICQCSLPVYPLGAVALPRADSTCQR